jgi:ribosomal protein S18 acetylase RimI-like enzyme
MRTNEAKVEWARLNLHLRTITTREEAQGTLALLEQAVREVGASAELAGGKRTPSELARRYLERLGPREAVLVVAEPRGVARPLALAASAPFEDPLTGEVQALLVLLYTDPSIRQRGVARSLTGELRRALAARGVRELWARAAHNDDALISMGERWGFVRTWELMSVE